MEGLSKVAKISEAIVYTQFPLSAFIEASDEQVVAILIKFMLDFPPDPQILGTILLEAGGLPAIQQFQQLQLALASPTRKSDSTPSGDVRDTTYVQIRTLANMLIESPGFAGQPHLLQDLSALGDYGAEYATNFVNLLLLQLARLPPSMVAEDPTIDYADWVLANMFEIDYEDFDGEVVWGQ